MVGISQGKGSGMQSSVGGLSQGKGGAMTASPGLPTHAGGKPVVQPPGRGGGLAGLFLGNKGYGDGGPGVALPDVAQPTSASLGLTVPAMQRTPTSRSAPPPVRSPAEPMEWPAGTPEVTRRLFRTPADMQRFYQSGNGRFGHETAYNGAPLPTAVAPGKVTPTRPVQPPPPLSQAALLARQINERARRRSRG